MALLTRKQVKELWGWSKSTLIRKVKQGCFPCYRPTKEVLYDEEEIKYYILSTREGNFEQRAQQRSGR